MTDRRAETILLRRASPADADALERIAQLDTAPLPPGPHLVAARGGAIQAAISLRTGELVANPFERTAELCELLRAHAASASAAGSPCRPLRPRIAGAPA